MKKALLFILFVVCFLCAFFCPPIFAQGVRKDDVAFRAGVGIAGANVAVCQPLATTAASVTANIATFTMASNPQTAGFVAGTQLQIAGFTGADTFFNAGAIANNTLTGGYTILSVTPTQIIVTLIHANASASTNGTAFQLGNSVTSCAGLSQLYTDATASVPSPTNPVVADGLGNYGYWTIPGQYIIQIYGATVTTKLYFVSLACVPNASVNCTGVFSGSIANLQVAFGTAPNTLGGSNSLQYNNLNGVVTDSAPALTFSAPTVVPSTSGVVTWGYTIVARQGTVNIATSAEGTTSVGVSPLSAGNHNTVTWVAVPGATAYDVFVSTAAGAVNPGYLATITAPTVTYSDTGTPNSDGVAFLPPPETGFQATLSGIHSGNMSWNDVRLIPNNIIATDGFGMDSPVSVLQTESSAPPTHGGMKQSTDFTAGNFFAYSNGSTRSPIGLNVLAISTVGSVNGNSGLVATAINNCTACTQNFNFGVTAAGVNNSSSNILINGAYYASTTTVHTITGTVGQTVDYFGDIFSGTKSPGNIGIFATYFAGQGAGAHSNAGAATLTAAYYTQDTGLGAGDWSFYSVGGKNFFGGPVVMGGAVPTLTGTGACATITTQTGGTTTGSAKCTGVTGASTLTITPGINTPTGWYCAVQDETTPANLFQQTAHTIAHCVLTITSVTQNDVFVFNATGF